MNHQPKQDIVNRPSNQMTRRDSTTVHRVPCTMHRPSQMTRRASSTVNRAPCTVYRSIIHIHIPSFPIAVAQVCRPALRGRPVAVAPALSERALILSVSLEAQKEGLFRGLPLSKAVKRCPGLKVIPPDPSLLERANRAMAKVVAQYTPLWEPSRPGHVYLDVTGTKRLWGKAKDTGHRLSKEIKVRLHLTGTAGVAGNKMVSSIASRITPSLEVLDVDRGREASFMAPLKVDMMPGIGRFRKKILLEELNIFRVQELAALDIGHLKLIFGGHAHVIHHAHVPSSRSPGRTLLLFNFLDRIGGLQ